MLEAAVAGTRREAARLGVPRPRVIGVTVLTSVAFTQRHTLPNRVAALAMQARRAGLDGVVASAQEASAIRHRVGRHFVIICPGIRSAAERRSDQSRVSTPREAIARGADFLVVGRPITQATDPRAVVQRILAEMEVT